MRFRTANTFLHPHLVSHGSHHFWQAVVAHAIGSINLGISLYITYWKFIIIIICCITLNICWMATRTASGGYKKQHVPMAFLWQHACVRWKTSSVCFRKNTRRLWLDGNWKCTSDFQLCSGHELNAVEFNWNQNFNTHFYSRLRRSSFCSIVRVVFNILNIFFVNVVFDLKMFRYAVQTFACRWLLQYCIRENNNNINI